MIPKEHMEFVKKMVEMAKAHGCTTFSMEFRPPMQPDFHHDIKASWSRGRHHEPASVLVQSQQWEYIDV